MTDHVAELRRVARLGDLPLGLLLLVGTVSEAEQDRLERLAMDWPRDRGWPPPRGVIREQLDERG